MGKTDIRQRLVAKFRGIARERIAAIATAFESLCAQSAEPDAADGMMREIHTLKGEARIMGFNEINDVAHVTEDLLEWARTRKYQVAAQHVELVTWGLDLVAQHLAEDAAEAAEQLLSSRESFFAEVGRALAGDGEAKSGADTPDAVAPANALAEAVVENEADSGTSPDLTARQATSTDSTVTQRRLDRRSTSDSDGGSGARLGAGLGDIVRVHGQTVAQLTRLTGELVIHHETITRFMQSLWALRAEPGDNSQSLNDTLRRLRDEGFEASLRLEELEDVVRRLRLLDIGVLFERYPPAIRELARERKKKVRVVLDQREVAVDKQVLDLIDASVLHILRNSIDHGIETVAERRAAGKSEQGTIVLAARQHGPRVEIEIRDDGRGISADKLRRAAVVQGVMTTEEAAALDDDAALALIFRPKFSTRREVSDVSGRGVGLDVVSDQVRALGGAVRLATDEGRGTAFTLDLPVSVALLRVLCVRCGAAIFGLPAAAIERVVRAPRDSIERAAQGHAIDIEGQRVPVVDFRREATDSRGDVEIVVIAHAGARIGICIDAFVGKRQVVQRSLGAFLSGLSLVSGTALLEEGKVAVLLSVPEIVRRFGEGDTRLVHALPEVAAAMSDWRVLVVDDSELTRDMLVGLARRARLTVTEAVNGREALSKIRSQPPDLILTDIDMPVMNGIQLIAAVRADPSHRDIPIIVLSTRGSDSDKRQALSAGASAYLVKSEFNEEMLHGTIQRFLGIGDQGLSL